MNADLRGLAKWILIFTLIQLFVNLIYTLLGYGYPFTTHLFRPGDRFGDLANFLSQASNYKELYLQPKSSTLPSNYLPQTYILGYYFEKIFSTSLQIPAFIAIITGLTVYSSICLARYLNERIMSVTIIILISYPYIFCLDRLNLEILILPFLILFFINIGKDKSNYYISFISFLKIYPIVYLWEYISKENFYNLIKITVLLLGSTILCYYFYNGTISENIHGNIKSIGYFGELYGNNQDGHMFSSSISNIFYYINLYQYKNLLKIIYISSLAIYYYKCGIKNRYLNYYLLTIIMILLPDTSSNYKLIPFLVFSIILISKNHIKNKYFIIINAAILSPLSYYHFGFGNEANIGDILRPILLIIVSFLSISVLHENLIKNEKKSE